MRDELIVKQINKNYMSGTFYLLIILSFTISIFKFMGAFDLKAFTLFELTLKIMFWLVVTLIVLYIVLPKKYMNQQFIDEYKCLKEGLK